jgi:glucose-1-phosphatase
LIQLTTSVEAVLFDVGGVLVRLSGVERLRAWTGPERSDDEIWHLWLHSRAVRAFESGRISEAAFAEELIGEMDLPVAPAELLEEFVRWIPDLFPGARELVEGVVAGVHRATLSNSNSLHWPRIMNEEDGMGLGGCFDSHFVSHLTGRIKPDPEAFEHAIRALGCRASSIVFVDDNQINVDAARELGIRAHRTRGAAEARSVLLEYGLLDETEF